MIEKPPREPEVLDEAALLARFVTDDGDPAGLVAYALHRKALLAFRADYSARTGSAPSPDAERAFLIAETAEPRMNQYHEEARRRLGTAPPPLPTPVTSEPAPRKRMRWTAIFGGPPVLMPDQPDTVNWRGLLTRLGILLLAVIMTSLLLRALFVRPL